MLALQNLFEGPITIYTSRFAQINLKAKSKLELNKGSSHDLLFPKSREPCIGPVGDFVLFWDLSSIHVSAPKSFWRAHYHYTSRFPRINLKAKSKLELHKGSSHNLLFPKSREPCTVLGPWVVLYFSGTFPVSMLALQNLFEGPITIYTSRFPQINLKAKSKLELHKGSSHNLLFPKSREPCTVLGPWVVLYFSGTFPVSMLALQNLFEGPITIYTSRFPQINLKAKSKLELNKGSSHDLLFPKSREPCTVFIVPARIFPISRGSPQHPC